MKDKYGILQDYLWAKQNELKNPSILFKDIACCLTSNTGMVWEVGTTIDEIISEMVAQKRIRIISKNKFKVLEPNSPAGRYGQCQSCGDWLYGQFSVMSCCGLTVCDDCKTKHGHPQKNDKPKTKQATKMKQMIQSPNEERALNTSNNISENMLDLASLTRSPLPLGRG